MESLHVITNGMTIGLNFDIHIISWWDACIHACMEMCL